MPSSRTGYYPYDLAKLVADRLRNSQVRSIPSEKLLGKLLETLYYASLKTDEGRPCRCTVNYVDPQDPTHGESEPGRGGGWAIVPFEQPLPFDVRSITKLAEATDPTSSSLAVYGDEEDMFIWGMVDQELRHADYVALDSIATPRRPGVFQTTIVGVGNLCVYKDFVLLGSLEQNNLVHEYHDVMWSGPVHAILKENLRTTLSEEAALPMGQLPGDDLEQVEDELLVRWQNAICRILMCIQHYRHGGGLLIVPSYLSTDLNVKYNLTYDRLPKAVVGLTKYQLLKRDTADIVAQHRRMASDVLPVETHIDAMTCQDRLDEHKSETLGCVRFIAALSRVDGFVLLDRSLVVHGFGVELRSDSDLAEISIAGDTHATPRLLRKASLSQFGTRHRAMMRYCHAHAGSLGFIISQDGDVRATMKVGSRLVLWENINVQLAFKEENRGDPIRNLMPMLGIFQQWADSVTSWRSV
ncbi:MAG: hypothetical protein MUF48_04830 [Pirellulaceae bacterium]|jgi:hypothetical protein|nr:hypothetical protein [Pirellulaceae bacterium]